MKHPLAFGLLLVGAALLVAPTVRAQEALPPEKTPPVLVPLPAPEKQLSKTRLRAIQIRNVPSNIIAWQLDPAHNSPPPGYELTQFETGQTPADSGPNLLLPQDLVAPLTELFVPVGDLELTAHWIQLDNEILAAELPAWNALGRSAWTRVATESERQTLEKLNQARKIAPVTQQLYATDKQPNIISYLPSLRLADLLREPTLKAPLDEMVIPTNPSLYDAPPYIPNLAETDPRLPEMAPMPGAGGSNVPTPTPKQLPPNPAGPYVNPYLRSKPGGIADMAGFKFQLTPLVEADKSITLTLAGFDVPANSFSVAKVEEGQTAVFSLPNILSAEQGQTLRVFLLVTPRKRTSFLFQLPQNPGPTPPAKAPPAPPATPTP